MGITTDFIKMIAPIIQIYAKKHGFKICSPIIAQAIIESGSGRSTLSTKYHNYFGMKCGSKWKGKSVNLKTKEEYEKGTLTEISANFRAYDNIDEGVNGYFEFISTPRYSKLKAITSPDEYVKELMRCGYATASTYVKVLLITIEKFGLTKYDKITSEKKGSIKDKIIERDKTDAKHEYYKKYTGTSYQIDIIFASIGVPARYTGSAVKRTLVAMTNGIVDYYGSIPQNIALIRLAKAGRLKKPMM